MGRQASGQAGWAAAGHAWHRGQLGTTVLRCGVALTASVVLVLEQVAVQHAVARKLPRLYAQLHVVVCIDQRDRDGVLVVALLQTCVYAQTGFYIVPLNVMPGLH